MIRLDMPQGPFWLDLKVGVHLHLHLRPCNTPLVLAARQAVRDTDFTDTPPELLHGVRTATFPKALGRLAILGWKGVGDAKGNPIEPTPAGIDALLDLHPVADAFSLLYLGPVALLEQEKNV
jgi:hypothetical protein